MTCCSDKIADHRKPFKEMQTWQSSHLLTLLHRYKRLPSAWVCFVTASHFPPLPPPPCFFSIGFCHLEFMQRSDSFSSLFSLLSSIKRCLSDLSSIQPHPQPLHLQTITFEISQKGLAKALGFAGCVQYRNRGNVNSKC